MGSKGLLPFPIISKKMKIKYRLKMWSSGVGFALTGRKYKKLFSNQINYEKLKNLPRIIF
jgi:hypothetical protein